MVNGNQKSVIGDSRGSRAAAMIVVLDTNIIAGATFWRGAVLFVSQSLQVLSKSLARCVLQL
jgi:hypothetical protein